MFDIEIRIKVTSEFLSVLYFPQELFSEYKRLVSLKPKWALSEKLISLTPSCIMLIQVNHSKYLYQHRSMDTAYIQVDGHSAYSLSVSKNN